MKHSAREIWQAHCPPVRNETPYWKKPVWLTSAHLNGWLAQPTLSSTASKPKYWHHWLAKIDLC